jgi:SAM-dependent methyltransferase
VIRAELASSSLSLNSYDRIAQLYDQDMGQNVSGKDIDFYVRAGVMARGQVLELGCGTGRIALPLIRAGCAVVGVDASLKMLQQMKRKADQLAAEERQRLLMGCMNMASLALNSKFALILCPYSAISYLIDETDFGNFLNAVRRCLKRTGRFILDIFAPRADVLCLPDEHVFFDYRREIADGLFLERRKTIEKDLSARKNRITRYYSLVGHGGSVLEEFSTRETIRYYFQTELKLLLQSHGFEVLGEYGDFEGQPFHDQAQMMVFVCGVPS